MKTVYQTDAGTYYGTEQEALLAEALDKESIYLESYKLKELIPAICKHFTLTSKYSDNPFKERRGTDCNCTLKEVEHEII